MSRFRPISTLQIARMCFALAGGMVLALFTLANSAQAGCGDYVFVRNASGQLVRASTLMKDHRGDCTGPECPNYHHDGAESDDQGATPEDSLPGKLPCNGPNCSNRSELPASPVPPPASPRSVQESTALLLNMTDGDHEAGARFGSAPSSGDHELHYPQSIFHPPR
jgi:hypothetical protein